MNLNFVLILNIKIENKKKENKINKSKVNFLPFKFEFFYNFF